MNHTLLIESMRHVAIGLLKTEDVTVNQLDGTNSAIIAVGKVAGDFVGMVLIQGSRAVGFKAFLVSPKSGIPVPFPG